MKTKILAVACAVLLTSCVVLSVFLASSIKSEKTPHNTTSADYATTTNKDIQFKLSLLHVYSEAQSLVLTLPFTTIQITESALVKALMSGNESVQHAVIYLNKYVDSPLAEAFNMMDEIIAKFKAVLKQYNISSTSSFTADYNNMSAMFSSLRSSSTELTNRCKSLILVSHSSNYDSSYTLYLEQLADLTGKIETFTSSLNDKYEALLAAISNDYELIK